MDLSWRFRSDTYLGIGGEWLWSKGERMAGVFDSSAFSSTVTASSTPEQLHFEEKSITANVNQLIGRDWSIGARYRLSQANLRERFTRVPVAAMPSALVEGEAVLQQLILSANFAHPSGFFAQAQALWYAQDNHDLPDSDFWQFNLFAGYRFAHRRAELLVGGLNLTDRDYRLNPLNLYSDLPRGRTLLVSLKLNF